ncbi:MAG: GTPase, partial [candidate division Zixibacteria bacterium]|nr:GTPase [candidate division Zixibacteria bacterium]NIR63514.1 GTPase [candidate division Zixibacteria bacterium]NIS45467.1 GTPase [candidate division Zixibacteria bacterium]NIU13609.1 GTPase [candidate division Zixibacteria bacterium]NIV05627.1 GTPase [candidate division Zixibacteria bacterium]
MTEKEVLEIIEQAARGGWTRLDLSGKDIKSLTAEIGNLTNLTRLNLNGNQLTSVPAEIGKLSNLKVLYLYDNQLTSVPAELGKLKNLTMLEAWGNQLTSIPAELGKLKNLTVVYLHLNKLTSVPAELGKLTNLGVLALNVNKLTSVPAELGKLTNLWFLYLHNNLLTSVPAELGKLTNLKELILSVNKLKSVPTELGNLTNLTTLDLSGNKLTNVPAELGKLTNLTWLSMESNQLTSVPVELGELTRLKELKLDGNPLELPPAEVVKQGTQAILAYLREQMKEKKRQWVSKLLLVGEGGVGKTSLLRSLRGEDFIEGLETTHGIGVDKFELAHPIDTDMAMELNTWDFGGQQIYHATHQFFLTNRALFVLVWDARHGWEAGKLYEWLDRIQARAPDSPVMIVAAHIDERDADLPLDDLRRKYPQITGHYKVSNKDGTGIDKFKAELAEAAAGLPLMG